MPDQAIIEAQRERAKRLRASIADIKGGRARPAANPRERIEEQVAEHRREAEYEKPEDEGSSGS